MLLSECRKNLYFKCDSVSEFEVHSTHDFSQFLMASQTANCQLPAIVTLTNFKLFTYLFTQDQPTQPTCKTTTSFQWHIGSRPSR
jgi:hypothetical protein